MAGPVSGAGSCCFDILFKRAHALVRPMFQQAQANVAAYVDPQGCEVFSFKQPSADELEHDCLWRTTCKFSAAMGFRRKYWTHYMKAYEDCLHATHP
jgi:polyphosphate kinase 2 (PPK2 family)